MADSDKHLAFAVATWLKSSGTDPKLQQAADLVGEAHGIDISDASQKAQFGSGPGLKNVWDVFMKTQAKMGGASGAAAASSSSAPLSEEGKPASQASDEDKAKAEALKGEGNKAMSSKDYSAAIASYTKAIELHGTNPVYFSNRSAAYAQVGQHEKAIEDAREASRVDPKFGKAYSRLGHALFSAGRYQEAVEAYEKGVEVDPSNALMKSGLETARQHAKSTMGTNDARGRDVSSPAGGAGGAGQDPFAGMGGGAGGGMPDLSGLMNNPMIAQMAQQMMSNGGLEQLMNNPMMQQMMSRFGGGGGGGGGGMPDMNAMMQDPQMREMARNFMGGAGGGGAGAGGRGSGRGSGGGNNNNNSGSNAGDNMFS